ncbi:MAG: hypothetical protein F6K30_05625 [Cyanothece sp. SIO2G6]|nr:hypothetical protein [Cyanothece sp. SIO2G6]
MVISSYLTDVFLSAPRSNGNSLLVSTASREHPFVSSSIRVSRVSILAIHSEESIFQSLLGKASPNGRGHNPATFTNSVAAAPSSSSGETESNVLAESDPAESDPAESGPVEPGPTETSPDNLPESVAPEFGSPGLDTTIWSEMLFQAQGSLELGDRTTFQDGSLYDEYALDGQAGQLLLITLESREFDAYLILLNDSGDIIAQNDDVAPDNTNSTLVITLPDNDIYIVVASGFKQSSRGQYLLTIWTSDQAAN